MTKFDLQQHAAAWRHAAATFKHYEEQWRHELQMQAQANRRLCETVAAGYETVAETAPLTAAPQGRREFTEK